MARYIVRRLGLSLPTLLGITLLTFLISHALPADLVLTSLGDHAAQDPQLVAAFRHKWGLDQPVPVQYAVYLGHLLRGDLGTSIATGSRSRRSLHCRCRRRSSWRRRACSRRSSSAGSSA